MFRIESSYLFTGPQMTCPAEDMSIQSVVGKLNWWQARYDPESSLQYDSLSTAISMSLMQKIKPDTG